MISAADPPQKLLLLGGKGKVPSQHKNDAESNQNDGCSWGIPWARTNPHIGGDTIPGAAGDGARHKVDSQLVRERDVVVPMSIDTKSPPADEL